MGQAPLQTPAMVNGAGPFTIRAARPLYNPRGHRPLYNPRGHGPLLATLRVMATPHDTNGRVGALLRDLAAVQTSVQSRWGYKRAASAILSLEEPLEALLQPDGTLRKIPG